MTINTVIWLKSTKCMWSEEKSRKWSQPEPSKCYGDSNYMHHLNAQQTCHAWKRPKRFWGFLLYITYTITICMYTRGVLCRIFCVIMSLTWCHQLSKCQQIHERVFESSNHCSQWLADDGSSNFWAVSFVYESIWSDIDHIRRITEDLTCFELWNSETYSWNYEHGERNIWLYSSIYIKFLCHHRNIVSTLPRLSIVDYSWLLQQTMTGLMYAYISPFAQFCYWSPFYIMNLLSLFNELLVNRVLDY